jgi:A nuclease family of the HNH/ENDO VII superfamily with conserved AHH
MDFAEQKRRPKQIVTPEYQSVSPEGSKAEPTLKELTNGVDHSKIPKALQNTPVFGELPAPPQGKAQGQSNSAVPVQASQPASQATQPKPMQLASATVTSTSPAPSSPVTNPTLAQASPSPQRVAQASAQPERSWLNSGVAGKGGLETIPFDGRIVRTSKEGKQVIIPVKFGQPFQMQPGDQLQYPMAVNDGKQKTTNPPAQANPVDTFKEKLQSNAISRLQQNKARLTKDEAQYRDTNPNNPSWQQLRTLAHKDESLRVEMVSATEQLMKFYNEQTKTKSPPVSYGLGVPAPKGDLAARRQQIFSTFSMQVKDPAAQAKLLKILDRIDMSEQARSDLEVMSPALGAINQDPSARQAALMGGTQADNQLLQKQIGSTFNGIRGSADQLMEQIRKDPSAVLQLDSIVGGTLGQMGVSDKKRKAGDPNSKAILEWLEHQRKVDGAIKTVGIAGTGLLGLAGLVSPFLGVPQAAPWLLRGAGALGLATGAYELPQLIQQNLAAESQQLGGRKLTPLELQETRFNLLMGYTNITLGVLDAGAGEVALRGLAKTPGAIKAFASLTRAQSRRLVDELAHVGGQIDEKIFQAKLATVRKLDDATTITVVNGNGTLAQSGPLNSTRNRMETTAAARASATAAKSPQIAANLSDEAAEKLLAKYPQWNNVKDFVGKHLDPNNLPSGYKYRVKNGKPELYRDSTKGPFPPLTVKDGVVMLQTGQSTRLSVFSRYKKNYLEWVEQTQGKAARTAAEQRIADGNQLHHLVPDAVVRENRLTKELMKRAKTYTLDRGTNILDMPVVHDPKTGKIVHLGSHPKFNKHVDGLLNLEIRDLTGRGAIPLEKVKVEDINKALRHVEDRLRDQITKRTLPKDILKEIEGGGFGISEGIKDPQRGEIA